MKIVFYKLSKKSRTMMAHEESSEFVYVSPAFFPCPYFKLFGSGSVFSTNPIWIRIHNTGFRAVYANTTTVTIEDFSGQYFPPPADDYKKGGRWQNFFIPQRMRSLGSEGSASSRGSSSHPFPPPPPDRGGGGRQYLRQQVDTTMTVLLNNNEL